MDNPWECRFLREIFWYGVGAAGDVLFVVGCSFLPLCCLFYFFLFSLLFLLLFLYILLISLNSLELSSTINGLFTADQWCGLFVVFLAFRAILFVVNASPGSFADCFCHFRKSLRPCNGMAWISRVKSFPTDLKTACYLWFQSSSLFWPARKSMKIHHAWINYFIVSLVACSLRSQHWKMPNRSSSTDTADVLMHSVGHATTTAENIRQLQPHHVYWYLIDGTDASRGM